MSGDCACQCLKAVIVSLTLLFLFSLVGHLVSVFDCILTTGLVFNNQC